MDELEKEKTTCPHCGEVVHKGNFCSVCAKKMVDECDCWVVHQKHNCHHDKCPGWQIAVDALSVLYKIQQHQNSRNCIVDKPLSEDVLPKTSDIRQ